MFKKALPAVISVILSVLCVAAILESSERDTASGQLPGRHADVIRLEKKIHTMINKEREKKGLPALSWDESLHKIARKYSQDMERRNFFSHYDPEGRCFTDRYKDASFECRVRVGHTVCSGAENISQFHLNNPSLYRDGKFFLHSDMEDKIARSVVKGWMSSRGHRENILTPYFRRQGIGAALSDDGKVYVTENFC
jgi:uncharacterized protein YkwD